MTTIGNWGGRAFAIGVLATALLPAPLAAQTVLHSSDDIAACLCHDKAVNDLKADVDRQKTAYDGAESDYRQLNDQVESQRPKVNVNDSGSIDAFRQLLNRRDAAAARLTNEVAPAYAATVSRYNAAVQSYTSLCGGKSYDVTVMDQVKQNLTCPK